MFQEHELKNEKFKMIREKFWEFSKKKKLCLILGL